MGAGAEVFFVHPLRPLHCLHGESKRHLLAGTGAGFFTMKSMKDMKAPLLSPCRPLRVLRGLHGEWNRLCVLAALREVFVGWVEGFSGEKAGSSLLDGVSGGSDLVLDGAFKVLGGASKVLDGAFKVLDEAFKVLDEAFKVLDGAFKVLDGAFKVLDEAFKVLDGAFKVLDGASKVLGGAFKVLGGAFKVLEEPEGVTGGAGKRPSTNAECLHPAEKIAAFCEVNALRRSGLVSPALGVWRCGSAPCSCRAGCFTACEKVRATRQRRAFDRRALR